MRTVSRYVVGVVSILVSIVIFVIPFTFIVFTAAKDRKESALLDFTWPSGWHLWSNIAEVWRARDYMLLTALINSVILTVASVAAMVVLAALVGYVLQRRRGWWTPVANLLILAGLIVPPAVVPTIWLMQKLGIYKTLPGLILIEIAFGLSFSVLLFRAFVAGIPRELDEAATIDGAGPLRLFFTVIFPLLRSVVVTVVVVQAVAVFNDFQNPLYFLPGNENATVQLTLFNFQSQYNSMRNLLFTDILLITIPPLLMYLFFNRQIVAGLTSGAVKG
jgi:raffinose/stachyose/melibiose transport system permease protein